MRYKIIISLIIGFLLPSCFGLFDSESDRIIDKYIVLWIDLEENRCISEQFEKNSAGSSVIVPAYVFAAGHNDEFIIAKQHPSEDFKTTNYFIIDMHRKIKKKGEKAFGPLTRKQFDSLRTELRIRDIKFDLKYPEKPY